ncbi:hypothetical protein CgunFtcFv8_004916 [Champsocephalus gunnari]|nr:hypothetical protein CgunFtcFv8_004916 [Champsocephalus gunnari]
MFQYLSTLSRTEHVVLYSDTCGLQNRNAGFSAMCLCLHIFMESGHSQMECDSVHAAIEAARKKVPVYSPEGYYTLVRMARRNRPYKVIELGHSAFLDFKSFSQHTVRNRTKDTEGQTVRHTKEDPKGIQFKYSLSDQPFQMLQVGKHETRGAHAIAPKKMHTGPPGITAVKKKDVLTLCTNGSIPHSYVDFYQSVQVIQAE